MQPWRKTLGCIPPAQDAAFVCQREQVLEVYQRPYDPRRPVVCRDEQPKQLRAETRPPLPARPGQPQRVDDEDVRQGVCTVWMFGEPLGCWRAVPVTTTKTAVDWAQQVKRLLQQPRYRDADGVTLVCDTLNTHTPAAFYQAFPPEEALRLVGKLELMHTPKQGRWLHIAEPELGVLTRQGLDRRIDQQAEVAAAAGCWSADRNARQSGVAGHFTTTKARTKLKHLYPKIVL